MNDPSLAYADFLHAKMSRFQAVGKGVAPDATHPILFPFQRDIVRWAVRKGRASIFADCGLGKTFCQLEWARLIGKRVLIVCPLSVAQQTIAEGKKLSLTVTWCDRPEPGDGIWITNYQKLQHFVGEPYDAMVLDESGILKSIDGKTRSLLLEHFTHIPYRLCCTATPSPNDIAELANHAEFLGVMKRREMLAHFFVHDAQGEQSSGSWRIKGHAKQEFWRWVASWAVYLRAPSDLGYADDGFILPPLTVKHERVNARFIPDGELFPRLTNGIKGRSEARKFSLPKRVKKAVEIITASWQTDTICDKLAACGNLNTQSTEKSAINQTNKSESVGERKADLQNAIKNICESGTPKIENENEQNKKPLDKQILKKLSLGESWTTNDIKNDTKRARELGNKRTLRENEAATCSELTVSLSNNLQSFSTNREESALSVNKLPKGEEKAKGFTSTTTTQPEKSEERSVPLAILDLECSETTQHDLELPPNTSKEQWLIWCNLNSEQDEIAKALGNNCVSIQGSTPPDERVRKELLWRTGKVPVLVTKTAQFGHGLNWQHCHKVLFLGLSDSFEQYYQSIRRCYRFGQTQPVEVVIVTGEAETQVLQNIKRKEADAQELAERIISHMKLDQIEEVRGEQKDHADYETSEATGKDWRVLLGDSVERIKEVEENSVGLSVFSPPFSSLYTYSASTRDIGNCENYEEFFAHFQFLIPELLRVTKPGRRACVHVQQVTMTKTMHGVIGWFDFRADVVKQFVKAGWVYDGEVVIDKDPQAQAIRTKSKALMFVQKNKDSAWSRPAMADYILLFRKEGENEEVVKTDVSNEEWIKWARPIWYDIRESNTLNAAEARESDDERHICPLQLETIERCIRLWSNPGDLVFDPFSGVGSTGFEAIRHRRKYLGIELKPSYFRTSLRNLRQAETQTQETPLFSAVL